MNENAPWVSHFIANGTSFSGYVDNVEDVHPLVEDFSYSTHTTYVTRDCSGQNFGDGVTQFRQKGLEKNSICFKTSGQLHKGETIYLGGIPFITIGRKTMECRYGRLRKWKKNMELQEEDHAYIQKADNNDRIMDRKSKKVDCPATIYLREILLFPDYQVKEDNRYRRSLWSMRLRRDLKDKLDRIVIESRIYIDLPERYKHSGHTMDMASDMKAPVHPDLFKAINQCVVEGVTNYEEVSGYLKQKVNMMFRGKRLPHSKHRRYYPSKYDIQQALRRAKKKIQKNPKTAAHPANSQSGSVGSTLPAEQSYDGAACAVQEQAMAVATLVNMENYENGNTFQPIEFETDCCEPVEVYIEEKDERPFVCSVCQRQFAKNCGLLTHMRLKHTTCVCPVCKKRFTHSDLRLHMRKHAGKNCYQCLVCELAFVTSGSLTEHMLRTHAREPYTCAVCEWSFINNIRLMLHLNTHTTDVVSFRCELCGRPFRSKISLAKHMKLHTGATQHACSLCEKVFDQYESLEAHLRTHTREKETDVSSVIERTHTTTIQNDTCELCGKAFPQPCTVCDQVFQEKTTLAEHMRTHPGEKLFMCNLCGSFFPPQYYIKHQHIQ